MSSAPRPRSQSTVPMPSSPHTFEPQHLTRPLSRMAHVWVWPAKSCTAPRPVPRYTKGSPSPISPARCPTAPRPVPGIPSFPQYSAPQHLSPPPSRTAHVWSSDADTCVAW